MQVRFSYLKEKFAHPDGIWERIKRDVVLPGDFTLGAEVKEFEERFARMMGVKHAIGVANGTDALELSLWALGVRAGDEVIAPANTFVASLGAIGNLQAKPVLIDMAPDHVMDPNLIDEAITDKTKAIIPVHFKGNPVAMDVVMEVAGRRGIPVVEDACQAYMAEYNGKCVGTFGSTGAFSLHPLKILNCWGDGGVITTNDSGLYEEIKLHQNHGMETRDKYTRFPCRNSRLDSIHAAVCNAQLSDIPFGVAKRRTNAAYYDKNLKDLVQVFPDGLGKKSVHHLYFIEVDAAIRDNLYSHLQMHGIECKIHYRVPLYLQPGLEVLGHRRGDFPAADEQCDRIITLPVDELVTKPMQDYVIEKIKEFFSR